MDDAFPDNWTYLRTELNWLDRVLAGAISRQRQETKAVNQVAKTRADQVTSHWWKGLIQLDGAIAGDSPADAPRRSTSAKMSYQQRLDLRIEASQRQGIVLGVPSLCQRLGLSAFEKNVVLMALAPEVSRRYGRIYNFLQETDHPGASGLPTIDLVLRLLCRNDSEWRVARLALSSQAKLVRYGIVVLPVSTTESFLAHPIKLADAIAEYLLADMPQLSTLDHLLVDAVVALTDFSPLDVPAVSVTNLEPEPAPTALIAAEPTVESLTVGVLDSGVVPVPSLPGGDGTLAAIAYCPPPTEDLWATLVLPDPLKATVRHLSDRLRYAHAIEVNWGFQEHRLSVTAHGGAALGTVALLTGAAGTGKTLIARAIAQSLNATLMVVDLAQLAPHQHELAWQQIMAQTPTVLLLQGANRWFGRSPSLPLPQLYRFLRDRQQSRTITVLSTTPTQPIKASWHAHLTITLNVPLPNRDGRLQLWHHAFPAAVPLDPELDWSALAQWPLSGGAIQAIAQDAAIFAVAAAAHQPPTPRKLARRRASVHRKSAQPPEQPHPPDLRCAPTDAPLLDGVMVKMTHLLQAYELWRRSKSI